MEDMEQSVSGVNQNFVQSPLSSLSSRRVASHSSSSGASSLSTSLDTITTASPTMVSPSGRSSTRSLFHIPSSSESESSTSESDSSLQSSYNNRSQGTENERPAPSAPAWVDQAQFHSLNANQDADVKAVKMDDAVVPVHLWNERIINHSAFQHEHQITNAHLDVIRGLLLRVWRMRVYKSFIHYMKQTWKNEFLCWQTGRRNVHNECKKDIEAGAACLYYVMNAEWWTWTAGSR